MRQGVITTVHINVVSLARTPTENFITFSSKEIPKFAPHCQCDVFAVGSKCYQALSLSLSLSLSLCPGCCVARAVLQEQQEQGPGVFFLYRCPGPVLVPWPCPGGLRVWRSQ